jgi:hypothetical protein
MSTDTATATSVTPTVAVGDTFTRTSTKSREEWTVTELLAGGNFRAAQADGSSRTFGGQTRSMKSYRWS